jgi:hypothetical protein
VLDATGIALVPELRMIGFADDPADPTDRTGRATGGAA